MSQYQTIVDPILPWDPYPGENNRLRILLGLMFLLALLITIVVHFTVIPVIERTKAEAIPDNLATVVLEQKKLPPPPPPVEAPKKEEKAETKTEEKPQVKEPVPEVEKQEPKAVQMDAKTAAARAKAKQEIQNAGFDDLASLRDMDVNAIQPKPGLPGETGNGTGGLITDTKEAGTSRNVISSRAGGYSGAMGGYSGGVSSGFGGGKAGGKGAAGGNGYALGGEGAGGGKIGDTIKGGALAGAGAHAKTKDGKSVRSDEDIRRVFDQNQGRLNNAYQRALRDNPTLQGEVVVKLTVAPDGSVTACSVASSALNDAELESKLVTIIKGFHFEAGEFAPWTGNHSLNFFPQ